MPRGGPDAECVPRYLLSLFLFMAIPRAFITRCLCRASRCVSGRRGAHFRSLVTDARRRCNNSAITRHTSDTRRPINRVLWLFLFRSHSPTVTPLANANVNIRTTWVLEKVSLKFFFIDAPFRIYNETLSNQNQFNTLYRFFFFTWLVVHCTREKSTLQFEHLSFKHSVSYTRRISAGGFFIKVFSREAFSASTHAIRDTCLRSPAAVQRCWYSETLAGSGCRTRQVALRPLR